MGFFYDVFGDPKKEFEKQKKRDAEWDKLFMESVREDDRIINKYAKNPNLDPRDFCRELDDNMKNFERKSRKYK